MERRSPSYADSDPLALLARLLLLYLAEDERWAPGLGPGGRRFKPTRPDHKPVKSQAVV